MNPTLLIISGTFGYTEKNAQTSLSVGVRRSKSLINERTDEKVSVAGDNVRLTLKSKRLNTRLSAFIRSRTFRLPLRRPHDLRHIRPPQKVINRDVEEVR